MHPSSHATAESLELPSYQSRHTDHTSSTDSKGGEQDFTQWANSFPPSKKAEVKGTSSHQSLKLFLNSPCMAHQELISALHEVKNIWFLAN
jgi:hypothetical protein